MAKNDKFVLAIGAIAAIGVLYLLAHHSSGAGIVTSNPANTPLPTVAPYSPPASVFNIAPGGYVPQSIGGGGCGCKMPGASNNSSNFLPATQTAFTDLVARSGVDPSSLNMTILAANADTDFFPQTSSLAQMILSGGPGALPG